MSRIGKLPISIPENVNINYANAEMTVKGKFGTLEIKIPDIINIEQTDTKPLHGLYRTLINNMVIGVSKQFDITLILKGVGYRGVVQGQELVLSLGYSHPVKIEIPTEISVEVVQNTTINIKSCDKELLGRFAANIRSWREPEPYKGKGILYKGENILRKAGKSGK
jgi:large subunit ribosomal protein L6